jgi:hypothetical protein
MGYASNYDTFSEGAPTLVAADGANLPGAARDRKESGTFPVAIFEFIQYGIAFS